MKVSITLEEGMACNSIFSCPFMQTIKASKMTDNNALVSKLLGYHFRREIMVTQRVKEVPKTSEGLPDSLPVAIQEKQDTINDRGSRNITVEPKKKVIHQRQIQGQRLGMSG